MVLVSDYLLGQLLIQHGMVAQSTLDACFHEQGQLQGSGVRASIAEVLARRGLLEPSRARQLQDHVAGLTFRCQRCRASVQVSQIAGAAQLQCPYCGGGLELEGAQASGVAAAPLAAPQPGGPGSWVQPASSARHIVPDSGRHNPPASGPGQTQVVYSNPTSPGSASSYARGVDSRFDGDVLRSQRSHPSTKKIVGTSGLISELDGRRFIGDFEIIDELGRGAMGVVYKVRPPGSPTAVALKLLLAGQMASELQVERFIREAEITSKLQHPNIVPIHEVGAVEGNPFFTMEFVDGKPLSYYIKRRKLGLRKSVVVARDIARALHYAHSARIIHRDIKPANVLLDNQGQPHVTDFGLARQIDDAESKRLTRSGAVIGTPYYMAPEQIEGAKDVGFEADIYALGVVLYEMLCFRLPFKAQSQIELSRMILKDAPPKPSDLEPAIDRKLDAITLKALAKKPGQRYSSAADFAADLDAYLAGEPIMARERVGGRGALIKGALAALGVAGLIGLGVSISAVVAPTDPPPSVAPDLPPPPDPSETADAARKQAEELVVSARNRIEEARTATDPELYLPNLRRAEDELCRAIAKAGPFEDATVLRGLVRTMLKDEAGARADLERAGDNPRAMFLLARLLHDDRGGEEYEQSNRKVLALMSRVANMDAASPYTRLAGAYSKAFGEDRMEEAVEDLEVLASRSPEVAADAHMLRGYILMKLNKAYDARKAFDAVLRLYPNQTSALGNRAQMLFIDGDMEQALRDATRLSKIDPESDTPYAVQAQIYALRKELEPALRSMRRFLELRPEDEEARVTYASLLSKNSNYAQAIRECERVMEEHPQFARVYEVMASIYAEHGRPADHDAILKVALERLESSADRQRIVSRLIAQLARRGKDGDILELCRDLRRRDPSDDLSYVVEGETLYSMGRVDEAIACLKEGIRVAPGSLRAYGMLFDVLMRERQLPSLEAAMQQLESERGQDAEALRLLATIYRRLNRYDIALDLLERARSYAPTNARILVDIAAIELAKARNDEAETLLNEALSGDRLQAKERAEAHSMLASIYAQRNRPDLAEKFLLIALKEDPTSLSARSLLVRVFFNANRHQEAAALARESLQLGVDADILDIYGRIALGRGDFKTAFKVFRDALQLRPRSNALHFFLSRTLLSMGQAKDAAGVAERGRQLPLDGVPQPAWDALERELREALERS